MLKMLCIGAAVVLGLLALANGLVMLVSPTAWYWTVPGVPMSGPLNLHFVRDIGLIFLLIGTSLLIGAANPRYRAVLWAVATFWLCCHAVLHLWEVAVGVHGPDALSRDFAAVTLPAIITIVLTLWAAGAFGKGEPESASATSRS
jgi:hypothetical protein